MKKILYNTIIVAVAAMTVSCGDSSIPDFNEEYSAVRFAGIAPDPDFRNHQVELTIYNFSFVNVPEASSYLYEIPVYLIGKELKNDTKVNFEIDAEASTAPEGSYEIVSAMIPAGSRNGSIAVRLFKTPELEGEVTYALSFHLLPSEGLNIGDSRYLTSRLVWNNNLPLPTHNNIIRSYNFLMAGTPSFSSTSAAYMSTNGLLAIVAALGWDDWDDPVAHPGQYNNATTYMSYKYLPRYSYIYLNNIYMVYSRMVGEWLDNYEKEHGEPLLHNGGLLEGQPVKSRFN